MNWVTLGIIYFLSAAAVAWSMCIHLLPDKHWSVRTAAAALWLIILGFVGVHGTVSEFRKEHALNPKDQIVAERLDAITYFGTMSLQGLFPNGGLRVIYEDHLDDLVTGLPDPRLLDGVAKVLRSIYILSPSNTTLNNTRLTWAAACAYDFEAVHIKCQEILTQFSQQNPELITITESLSRQSMNMAFYCHTFDTPPVRAVFLEHPLPDQYVEFFRFYLLTLMKTHRVVEKFGVKH
jgi:hypothetical protein